MPVKFDFKSAGKAFLFVFAILVAVIAFAPREATDTKVGSARRQIDDLGGILTPYFDLCKPAPPQPVPVKLIIDDKCLREVTEKLPAMKPMLDSEIMKQAATDPWGNDIYFQNKGGEFYLMSWGSDHKGGGVSSAADIVKKVR